MTRVGEKNVNSPTAVTISASQTFTKKRRLRKNPTEMLSMFVCTYHLSMKQGSCVLFIKKSVVQPLSSEMEELSDAGYHSGTS